MLIEPTHKFSTYIFYSKHFLNCPKHMLNYQLRSIIMLCFGNYQLAEQRVLEAKKYYGLSIPNVKDLIEYHWNTKEKVFNKINVNPYIDNPPQHIIKRNNFINNWYATKTKEVWLNGRLVYTIPPPSPFND